MMVRNRVKTIAVITTLCHTTVKILRTLFFRLLCVRAVGENSGISRPFTLTDWLKHVPIKSLEKVGLPTTVKRTGILKLGSYWAGALQLIQSCTQSRATTRTSVATQ